MRRAGNVDKQTLTPTAAFLQTAGERMNERANERKRAVGRSARANAKKCVSIERTFANHRRQERSFHRANLGRVAAAARENGRSRNHRRGHGGFDRNRAMIAARDSNYTNATIIARRTQGGVFLDVSDLKTAEMTRRRTREDRDSSDCALPISIGGYRRTHRRLRLRRSTDRSISRTIAVTGSRLQL